MNSYNKPRNMSYKGIRTQAMPASKLMAIENKYHHTKDALVREIKRLRGEVGVLAKRYNNSKREIAELVEKVRSQPPPPIPKRDEEMEKEIEERHKRWREHLLKEEKVEKEKEEEGKKGKEEDSDTVMPIAIEVEIEPPIEIIANTASPEHALLDHSPPPTESIIIEMQVPDSTPPESKAESDVGMEDEEVVRQRVTVLDINEEDDWGDDMRKLEKSERLRIYEGKRKRWEECCKLMKIGKYEMGLEGDLDLDQVADRILEIVDEWNEMQRKGSFRGWGKPRLLDGMLYAGKKLRWRNLKLTKDGMRFTE